VGSIPTFGIASYLIRLKTGQHQFPIDSSNARSIMESTTTISRNRALSRASPFISDASGGRAMEPRTNTKTRIGASHGRHDDCRQTPCGDYRVAEILDETPTDVKYVARCNACGAEIVWTGRDDQPEDLFI
jgi:hypothetical protein